MALKIIKNFDSSFTLDPRQKKHSLLKNKNFCSRLVKNRAQSWNLANSFFNPFPTAKERLKGCLPSLSSIIIQTNTLLLMSTEVHVQSQNV